MKCPICNSTTPEQVHDSVWSSPGVEVFRCQNCTVGFLYPMMTESEEKKFYAAYNEHTRKRGVTITTAPQELHQKSIMEAETRWKRLKFFFNQGTRVLEIGASTGAFLEQCAKTCECACVEPDPVNRKFASQFSIKQYEYTDNIPDSEKFDVICLFHVFEHIKTPAVFLQQCNRLLEAGGIIVIEVPHIEDPLLSVYNLEAYKDFYFQPMHHYIYSAKSLRHIFESNGFFKKDIIYTQRYGLDNHLTWLKKAKPGGDPEFTELFGKCPDYCRALETAQKTDTITFIAEKKS